jgi:hypothetical protein
MFASRAVGTIVAVAFALLGCASTNANRAVSTQQSRKELALEVAQSSFSREEWRAFILAISQSLQQAFERIAEKEKRKPPPREIAQIMAEIVGEEIPYETMCAFTADLLLRHFTDAEMKELVAINRSAVYRKMSRLTTVHREGGVRVPTERHQSTGTGRASTQFIGAGVERVSRSSQAASAGAHSPRQRVCIVPSARRDRISHPRPS